MEDLRKQLEGVLESFWDENIIPTVGANSSTMEDLLLPLDSITACEVLVNLEAIVNMNLPIGEIVQHGGYQTKDEFVGQVAAAVMKHVEAAS